MTTLSQDSPQRPSPDDPLGLQFTDGERQPQQVMSQIRQRIHDRRVEMGYLQPIFPSLGGTVHPEKPTDIPYDPNLYHQIALLNKLYNTAETEPDIRPSPSTRVPILGRLWVMIRNQAHGLVLFYVNRALAHNLNVNQYLVNIVNLLVIHNQELQRQLLRMQEEVDSLRTEIRE